MIVKTAVLILIALFVIYMGMNLLEIIYGWRNKDDEQK